MSRDVISLGEPLTRMHSFFNSCIHSLKSSYSYCSQCQEGPFGLISPNLPSDLSSVAKVGGRQLVLLHTHMAWAGGSTLSFTDLRALCEEGKWVWQLVLLRAFGVGHTAWTQGSCLIDTLDSQPPACSLIH
jgi:hypothetical protein